MDKDEPFILNEVDYKTPKLSPQSNQTWPMDKIQQNRFQLKMASLLSPVTPKRNCSISNSKSLLLQCLRESKSDPLPRRRVRASCSDEGVLMDGVLVTSATGKKVLDTPSTSLGRSARSSVVRIQHKNSEFSSPRSENQENIRPQHFSGGKGKIQAISPSTKLETPKAAKPSKLQSTAEPFILTPKSSQILISPVPLQQLSLNHDPHFQCGDPPPLTPPGYGHPYLPPRYAYPRPLLGPPVPYLQFPHGPELYQKRHLARLLRPIDYQLPHDLNQSPSSSQTNTHTNEPPVHTSTSSNTTASLSTRTTTHGSRLDSPLSVDGNHTVTQKLELSSPSDELETMGSKPDLSPFAGLGTMKRKKEWSPSDDGLPTFTQAQTEFMESQNRVLPDDVFEHYKYRQRLPVFTQLCLNDNLLPQTKPQEDQ